MSYGIDIQTFGEIIEDFLVNYFDNLDVAGAVATKQQGKINYVGVDLSALPEWDQNSEKIVNEIRVYLNNLFKAKPLDEYYMVKFQNITREIKTANGENNISKNLRLFYLNGRIAEDEKKPNVLFKFLKLHWRLIASASLTLVLTGGVFWYLSCNANKVNDLQVALSQVYLFSGITGAFVLLMF